MARGKMASVENRWQMKAPPSSFLHPWHIASPPDLGSSPGSLLCIWQRKIRLDSGIIAQEVGPALLISIILINQTSKIHPNALWQSCNGEMDIGFFQFLEKNTTFTFFAQFPLLKGRELWEYQCPNTLFLRQKLLLCNDEITVLRFVFSPRTSQRCA